MKYKINKKTNSRSDILFNNNLVMPKRSQVTIFIILALILVVGIVLIFVLIKKPEIQIEDVKNPQAYIESCTHDAVEEAIDILSEQGGDISPKGSTMFRGKNITYLCYNANYYAPCINQRPLLIEHIQDEITNYITPKVENCFQSLKKELEKKNYIVEIGEMELKTELQTEQVSVNINRDFKMSNRDTTREFKNFKMNLVYPIYEMLKVAMKITNQEAEFCNFDILSFMIFYPEYDVSKFRPGNSDVIYQIRDKTTNQEFKFAIRSCALPPGF